MLLCCQNGTTLLTNRPVESWSGEQRLSVAIALGYPDPRRQREKQITSDFHEFSWAPILQVHLEEEALGPSLSQMAHWHHLLAGPVNMHSVWLRVHSKVALLALGKISDHSSESSSTPSAVFYLWSLIAFKPVFKSQALKSPGFHGRPIAHPPPFADFVQSYIDISGFLFHSLPAKTLYSTSFLFISRI